MSAMRDRDSEANSRTLLHAVSAEECSLHAECNFSFTYNFVVYLDGQDASIRAVRMPKENLRKSATTQPTPTLFTDK